jgi:DNA-binding PadR family transcriptional regulator
MAREAATGHVDLLLLSVLDDRAAHGYRLVEVLRERSSGAFDLAEGTLYPALYRLEKQGLVGSSWETVSGRRRRMYRLTRKGRGALADRRTEWRRFVAAVDAVVG